MSLPTHALTISPRPSYPIFTQNHSSFKSGKVVIILSGRFAGRKAVVVKASDEGNKEKRFGHAIGTPNLLVFFPPALFPWIPSLKILLSPLAPFSVHLHSGWH